MKRIFAGLMGLALVVTLVGFLASQFTIVATGATPLPAGCYTDGFGLAVCGPNYVGPGGTPGPQATSSPNTLVAVAASCPGTFAAASSYPYNLTVGFPSPAATATSTAGAGSASWSCTGGVNTIAIAFPVASSAPAVVVSPSPGGPITVGVSGSTYSVGCATCAVRSSVANGATWDTAVCGGEASVTHCYPMNGPIGTATGDCQFDDATATANPSPVPLATPTTFSTITCGVPGIVSDGETAVAFSGITASSYLTVPSTVTPTSTSAPGFSFEMVVKDTDTLAVLGDKPETYFVMDNSTSFAIQLGPPAGGAQGPVGPRLFVQGSGTGAYSIIGMATPVMYLYTWDGSHANFYANCDLLLSQGVTGPLTPNGSAGALGTFLNGGPVSPFEGRMAKFAVANTAFTVGKCRAHLAALGL